MVIQLTQQSAGENHQSAFLALMGIPIPVYASPTVSRMVICLEWLKEAMHMVSRMVIQCMQAPR